MTAVYRVYLRTKDGQVPDGSKTITPSRDAAIAAFSELVNKTELDGQKLAAVLSHQNRQVAYHRFDREPGQVDYWRDRINEIDFE